jgi:hypothetical protein
MSTVRKVLVVHPDDARRRALCTLLGEVEVEVLEAATRDEAGPLLTSTLSLVVSHHQDFKKLLRDLDRRAPAAVRAVLCPADEAVQAALVELAAQGYDFVTLEDHAPEALRELASPRRTARLEPTRPFTVTFDQAGTPFEGVLLEVSSDGFSVRLPPDAPSELLAVGAVVSGCVVRDSQGVVVLRHWGAQVRSRDRARVGLALLRPPETPASDFAATHPIQVAGAIRRAVRRGEAFSLSKLDGSATQPFESAQVDAAHNRVVLEGVGASGFLPGEVVRLSFERAGRVFQGSAVVLEAVGGARAVTLPSTLVHRNRRSSIRVTPSGEAPVQLHLVCPFTGRASTHRLNDLQPDGASFTFEDGAHVYPPGLMLGEGELEVEGRRCAVGVQVQTVSVVARRAQPLHRRTGVRFSWSSLESRQALEDALITMRSPEVVCAGTQPFPAIWELIGAAGARFPDYDPTREPPAELVRTHRLVGDGHHGLAKSFVWRSGALLGHVGGLRIYSGTWLSQHLAVRPGHTRGVAVSQALVSLMVDHAEALEDVHWVRGFWQRSNRWTTRIYGAIAGRLARSGRIARSSFELCQCSAPLTAEAPGPTPARVAGAREHAALLELLRERSPEVLLQANDLTAAGLAMGALASRYERSGLARTRLVGVVGPADAPRGWVLLEDMTPGLCWAELFRTFSFVLAAPDEPDTDGVRAALLHFAHQQAAERGWPVIRARVDATDAGWLTQHGYANLGGVEELTVHRSVLREWNELLLATFERASSLHRDGEST